MLPEAEMFRLHFFYVLEGKKRFDCVFLLYKFGLIGLCRVFLFVPLLSCCIFVVVFGDWKELQSCILPDLGLHRFCFLPWKAPRHYFLESCATANQVAQAAGWAQDPTEISGRNPKTLEFSVGFKEGRFSPRSVLGQFSWNWCRRSELRAWKDTIFGLKNQLKDQSPGYLLWGHWKCLT